MDKPNVIIIFADDLGMGDVSAFNPQSKIHTKNIDYLASQGIRFTDSHATSAMCTPSRYGLLTGRYNWRSRLKSGVLPGDSESLIEKDRKTLPQLFKDYGYQTAAIGKWHLGMDWTLRQEGKDHALFGLDPEIEIARSAPIQKGRQGLMGNGTGEPYVRGLDIDYSQPITFGPIDLGFDYFYGTPASLDQGPFVIIENDRVLDEPTVIAGNSGIDRYSSATGEKGRRTLEMGVMSLEASPYHIPDMMQEKVLSTMDHFLKNQDPFFLYYPNHLVHGPLLPKPEFKGKSNAGTYGDFVLQLDHYVGEIIEKLKAYQQFENTVIIFTSDNGVSPILDLATLKKQGHDPSNGFRGRKMQIWEGGHREPTIVTYPNMIPAGQVSNHLVSHADFYRTFAEMLGATLDDQMAEDSISNLSLWQGKNQVVRDHIIYSSGNGGFSIRKGFWKLTLVDEEKTEGGMTAPFDINDSSTFEPLFRPYALYDLREDLSETTNVIDSHPDIVKSLTRDLITAIQTGRTTPGRTQTNAPDMPSGQWPQIQFMEDSLDES